MRSTLACEEHYEAGGDWIVETMAPDDLLGQFNSVEAARQFCALQCDRAKDARWGKILIVNSTGHTGNRWRAL